MSTSKEQNEVSSSSSLERATPAYGSKEYWDQRYSKRQKVDNQLTCSVIDQSSSKLSDDNEEEAEPEHAWYFTHEELLPLLEPIISDIYETKREGINICEIGCGDVPLGADLLSSLNNDNENLINRMICSDYSKVVINTLLEKQHGEFSTYKMHQQKGLEYIVADARHLSTHFISSTKKNRQDKGLFDMIIDKGTLDAMLSDEEQGQNNCKAIVREVTSDASLSVGGCFIIVSHLNANTSTGMRWLQDVIIESLHLKSNTKRNHDTSEVNSYKWEIEVHGSGCDNEQSDEDEEAFPNQDDISTSNDINDTEVETDNFPENSDESISPGPAVYVIKKVGILNSSKDQNSDDEDEENVDEIELGVSVNFVYY